MEKLKSFLMIAIMLTVILLPGQAQAATVKISKTKATLEVDATLQLKITGSESAVKWSSSKETVASVTSKGLVTALKAGTSTVTAAVNGKDYLCTIYVVNSKNVSIAVGETKEFIKGVYIVGEDIPAGKYDLTSNTEFCRLRVYDTEDSEYATISEQIGKEEGGYNNLKLVKGNKVEIYYNGTIIFTREK
jgi:uncharacterized protein YjdB